jgi:signal transduction histidine kinase
MALEKGVKILSHISGKVRIMGNKRLLEELLTNLVVNAVAYRRVEVESTVTISLKGDEKDVQIIVEDNGLGISSEDVPEIFSRFYSGSRKSNTGGTGLGLAICKKISEKHGGTISVTSSVGEGTTFTITIPRIRDEG